jgi:DNA invertase Pin-like site-specific DNA recombinase
MIAAIYARKSTSETGINDEEKSVTRQIEHAKAYAAKKGWTVAEELIFVDDGISGAEFVKRPGFLRLMNALKPRPPFQALVMSEESRLGREQIHTAFALHRSRTPGCASSSTSRIRSASSTRRSRRSWGRSPDSRQKWSARKRASASMMR